MTNVVGVKALKEFNLVGHGMFFKDKVYFVAPELGATLLKRGLVTEFTPKEPKPKVEKEVYQKKKKSDKIISDNN